MFCFYCHFVLAEHYSIVFSTFKTIVFHNFNNFHLAACFHMDSTNLRDQSSFYKENLVCLYDQALNTSTHFHWCAIMRPVELLVLPCRAYRRASPLLLPPNSTTIRQPVSLCLLKLTCRHSSPTTSIQIARFCEERISPS